MSNVGFESKAPRLDFWLMQRSDWLGHLSNYSLKKTKNQFSLYLRICLQSLAKSCLVQWVLKFPHYFFMRRSFIFKDKTWQSLHRFLIISGISFHLIWMEMYAGKTLTNTFTFLKFKYFEKATRICEIFTLQLSYVVPVKSKVKILQNLVASSENMDFMLNQV